MEKLSVNITKRKDGRYMGKFIVGYDDSGKAQYQYVYGKTYDEAESKVLIGQEVALRYLSGRYITVGKGYEEWLNAVVNRVKESSLANYKAKFEKHILPFFGDMPCADLSAVRINEFINKKLADGLSASYVRDIFTVFKSMLRYAQEEYGFKLSLKNVVLPKVEKKNIDKINDAEQGQFVSYLKANISLTAFGILLSLYMGLRIGELCGLKWNDVDFQKKILHIRRTVQRIASPNGNRKTKLVISTPKSATSFRDIAIPEFLMEYFKMFQDEADFFILSGSQKPVEPRTMQYRYKKTLQSAEIGNHNYHKLRHTFATNCAEKGFDIKTLSMILGHSTVNLTLNRYIHPDHTHERKMMNSMCLQL
ncbi:MAG: site-specific integrase [Ruminococcus sp.]|nr:site-specific integrase [Ruminococcus sp.]